jgi:hypothetical protein
MNNYYRADGWVKSVQGPAIPGAQIYVCLQPANVTPPITPPRTLPVPWVGPNPQALIYSDAGTTPIVQPIITDGFGHYDFYTLPGLYTVVVMYGNKVQQFYIDQSIGNVGSSSSSLLLSTNGTPNFNQSLQNLVQGAGVTIVTDNFGNTTITGSGGSGITYPGNPLVFLNGTGVFSVPPYPTPATMTNTVGGLVPTPPNDATKFLNGTGVFSTPAGGGSSVVLQVSYTLSSAQILALDAFGGANNIQLLPAPGVNKMYVMVHTDLYYKSGGIGYSNNGEIDVGLTAAAASPSFLFASHSAFGFMLATTDSWVGYVYEGNIEVGAPANPTTAINKPLIIFNDDGASFTVGNGTVKIIVNYFIADLS